MSDAPPKQTLPRQFIDALIGYAMDPLQWEAFADALDTGKSELQTIEPSAFLATLSQAETLAWQMRGQPDQAINNANCIFFLLNAQGLVLQASANAAVLEEYCSATEGGMAFHSTVSAKDFATGISALASGERKQVLVELLGDQKNSRYGYLITADDLPAAINMQSEHVRYGFLIAQAESSLQARSVLKSSFGLTAAETAVCEQLISGLQLKEVAHALNISTNTARNHLQAVFEKTGINRQSDLILMMTQLSVILSVIGSHGDAPTTGPSEANYPNYRFAIVNAENSPRRVAYRRYGNGQQNVIYFHEAAGSSRLLAGSEDIAEQLDLSIFAPERPGTGFSDPLEHFNFNDTANDIATFIEQLQLEKVTLLGYLSGAAHALSAAAKLGSKVDHLMLVAGRGPGGFNTNDDSTIAVLRRRLTDQPWLLATFFNILRNRANDTINRRLLMRLYGAVDHDRELFQAQPELLDHMVAYTLESMIVSASGIIGDIRCFTKPTPIDINAITAPISVWHGSADTLATLEALQTELGDHINHQRIFDQCGSAIVLEHWSEILEYLGRKDF